MNAPEMSFAPAAVTAGEREIVMNRVYGFPREQVFRAWTDPQQIAHWWGPDGVTNTISEMDVRPGGSWRFVMQGPDGTDYPNRIVYLEVEPPSLLRYAHGGDNGGDDFTPDFHVTVVFEALGAHTRLTATLVFDSAEACAEVQRFGALEGGRQTFERLAQFLARTAETGELR